MWRKINSNPGQRRVGDCVIRAIATATDRPWVDVYDDLYRMGRDEYDMMSSNALWGRYLYDLGFHPFILPDSCPQCVTVREFCKHYPHGRYIIGTGSHAIAIIDGDYFDTFDSGGLTPTYFFAVR